MLIITHKQIKVKEYEKLMQQLWFNLFVQGLGFFGILSSIISFQCTKHNSIMLFRTGNEFLFGLQYLFLGAYTGLAMNIIGCIRNQIFASQVKRNRSTLISQIIFSAIFLIGGIISWSGYESILIIVAKILSTIAYSLKNTKILRLIILFTSTSWLLYNILVQSYAGVLCELFTISSIIVAIIRFYIRPCNK